MLARIVVVFVAAVAVAAAAVVNAAIVCYSFIMCGQGCHKSAIYTCAPVCTHTPCMPRHDTLLVGNATYSTTFQMAWRRFCKNPTQIVNENKSQAVNMTHASFNSTHIQTAM